MHGDMYFVLRSTMTPLECRSGGQTKDCDNAEVVSNDLIVRELNLEVDSRFTQYSLCNVCVNGSDNHGNNHCQDGTYTCTCPSYGGGGCNASIGARACNRMGGRSCYSREPNWSCWRGKTAMKTVDGMWFSTLANGLCNSTASFCTWRVLEVAKRVSQSCLNNNLYDAVEGYNRSAFAPCGTRNTSSTCWIEAFYDSFQGKMEGATLPALRPSLWSARLVGAVADVAARCGSAASVLNFVHLGSSLSLRSFARMGSAVSIMDCFH